jgi:excisionase family DNA binding protein
MEAEAIETGDGGHELLKTGGVAERLRVTERTVRRWAADGTIPAIQLGGAGTHLRIPAAALERWLRPGGREAA